MEDTFILDPDYIDYTPEKLKYETFIPEKLRAFIEDNSLMGLLFLPHLIGLPLLMIFFVLIDSLNKMSIVMEFLASVYVVYTILASIVIIGDYLVNLNKFLRLRNRCVRLVSHGVIIEGHIIEATGEYKQKTLQSDYYVTVRYQYMTLSGYEHEGTQTLLRNDLRKTPLPRKGTPVKVLYADEDAVMML